MWYESFVLNLRVSTSQDICGFLLVLESLIPVRKSLTEYSIVLKNIIWSVVYCHKIYTYIHMYLDWHTETRNDAITFTHLRTWSPSIFVIGSHMMVSLVFRLQYIPGLHEPFHSLSFSVCPICCTSELCNECSAAGEPCCDPNTSCGSERAWGAWRKEKGE